MRPFDLPTPSFHVFLAGYAKSACHMYMLRARECPYPETKKMFVDWARAEHHAYLKYMKLAEQI